MDPQINSYSCVEHHFLSYQNHITWPENSDSTIFVETHDYCFKTQPYQKGVINFLVTTSTHTKIKIFCADFVDLKVRFIILFPESASIELSINLCGLSSKIIVFALCALAKNQSVQLKMHQVHCGQKSYSQFVLQTLLAGQAFLEYEGTIRIEEKASDSFALQNNKNILLSSTAGVVSVPNIEVLHNNVQCYHGSAVGRFELQQICYMKSRGLDDATIKRMLIQALFADLLQGYEKKEFILQEIYEKI